MSLKRTMSVDTSIPRENLRKVLLGKQHPWFYAPSSMTIQPVLRVVTRPCAESVDLLAFEGKPLPRIGAGRLQ